MSQFLSLGTVGTKIDAYGRWDKKLSSTQF